MLTLLELQDWLNRLGAKPQHARRVYRAMLNVATWPRLDDEKFPKKLRLAIPEIQSKFENVLRIVHQDDATENEAAKLLFELQDGQTIESVLLPREGVCVSSQVGCAVGCVFCMTGKGGLIRQLDALEIIAQVAYARKVRPDTRKVAFMGMGEPSHNLRAVMAAIEFLGTYGDFPHKNLVLSTVGDQRVFDMLADSVVKPALAVSLHSTIDEKRRQLLPKAGRISVDSLIEQAENYARATGYPTQYQWTLIDGLNDGDDELERIKAYLTGKYAMMNFIPVNVVEDSPYQRPPIERCAQMARFLHQHHIVAKLRHSAAQEVQGGCGQLRARKLQEN